MIKQRVTCTVYITQKENEMLDKLEVVMNEKTYSKIGRSKIFCIALKDLYEKIMNDHTDEK